MSKFCDKSNCILSIKDSFVFNYCNQQYSPTSIIPHFHDVYEMLLFINGDCEYSVEGNIYPINHMDLILTNTKELHTPLFRSNAPYERINILINPSFLSDFVTDSYNPLSVFENRALGKQNKIDGNTVLKHEINNYFSLIKDALEANNHHTEILVKTLLVQMLIKIEDTLDLSKNYYSNEKVSAIIRYISENLDSELNYETLSRIVFVSKNYLHRLFKQQTGFTLSEYIKIKRISKAKELLSKGISSTAVAHMVGFSDYSSFFRAFKSLADISPSEYIKQIYP
jgi:AraC-like DNA-binding protein